jgi:ATP-dependent Clp protease ATP-binding subunit ClpC
MLKPEILEKMTIHAKKSLVEAEKIAGYYNCQEIMPEHLLLAIFLEEGSLGSNIMKSLGIKREFFNKFIEADERARKKEQLKIVPASKLSTETKSIIIKSFSSASSFGYPYVGTEHLVYALTESKNPVIQKIMEKSVASRKDGQEIDISKIIEANMHQDSFPHLSKIFDLPEIGLSKKNKRPSATPYLDKFCINLNEEVVKRKEIIIGREKEISRIINILGRKNKNNPVLIGDPGVGKTALVSGLAQKINLGEVPRGLLEKKILSLDIALVVAGTSFRGEFETRLKEIIREAEENKNIILFIDEIHIIVGAGNVSGGMDAANILKPVFARGDIQCIGATTLSEYKKYIEKDPALERRFQPVHVSEATPEETKKILEGIKTNYETFHNVSISKEAIDAAVDFSVRYIADRFLPDKAIDLIDETASALRSIQLSDNLSKKIKQLESEREKVMEEKNKLVDESNYEDAIDLRQKEKGLSQEIEFIKNKQEEIEKKHTTTLSEADVARTVSQITGIPIEKMSFGHSSGKIRNLKKSLLNKVIGQKETLEKITDVIVRSYSGIGNPDRPLGSFLFLGPTGVGKTLTAKVLAESIFESSKNLVQIDMSEFMERHNVSRLVGAPAGYIGYEEGGRLTEKIRHQPYSLVLFDEIEKAHPDVFNLLLQILEEGTLTDAEGRKVNFKNTIVILTSNLGTSEFTEQAKIGFHSKNNLAKNFEEIKSNVLSTLKKQIKPEIINRLDHIVVFNSLNEKEILKIVSLELEKFKKRLAEKKLKIIYSNQLLKFLAKKSLAIDQGARLVRKNIQELVENPVARMIVEGKIKINNINLDIKNGKIIIF